MGRAIFKEDHDDGWQHYTVMFDGPGTGLVIITNSSNGEGIFQELLERLIKNKGLVLRAVRIEQDRV